MAQMYFSKFNINSEIYKVYKDEKLKNKILDEVFYKMTDEHYYIESETKEGKEIEVKYKFCDLVKDNATRNITGRLVKIYPAELQSYDPEKDTVTTKEADNCAASSTFYLDLLSEEIAFITRSGLGYNQFNKHFKILIDNLFEEFTFEIFLENNVGELKNKLNSMKRVLSIKSTIIPPNANSDDFANIFGPSKQEFELSGATKFSSILEVAARGISTININIDFFNRILYAISKGYGLLIAKGKSFADHDMSITSDEDTPYKETIPDLEKDSLMAFKDRAKTGISKLIQDKIISSEQFIKEDK